MFSYGFGDEFCGKFHSCGFQFHLHGSVSCKSADAAVEVPGGDFPSESAAQGEEWHSPPMEQWHRPFFDSSGEAVADHHVAASSGQWKVHWLQMVEIVGGVAVSVDDDPAFAMGDPGSEGSAVSSPVFVYDPGAMESCHPGGVVGAAVVDHQDFPGYLICVICLILPSEEFFCFLDAYSYGGFFIQTWHENGDLAGLFI